MTLVPAATTYANKKDAYIYIEYPGIGLIGEKAVKFKGFLTEYTDTVTANWNKEELLQRHCGGAGRHSGGLRTNHRVRGQA